MVFLILILISSLWGAQDIPSVMLSPTEKEALFAAIPHKQAPIHESFINKIYVSGILYLSPTQWTVWVNDKRFQSSQENQAKIYQWEIEHVSEDCIRLKNIQTQKTVTLFPHQTLLVDSEEVIEETSPQRLTPLPKTSDGKAPPKD